MRRRVPQALVDSFRSSAWPVDSRRQEPASKRGCRRRKDAVVHAGSPRTVAAASYWPEFCSVAKTPTPLVATSGLADGRVLRRVRRRWVDPSAVGVIRHLIVRDLNVVVVFNLGHRDALLDRREQGPRRQSSQPRPVQSRVKLAAMMPAAQPCSSRCACCGAGTSTRATSSTSERSWPVCHVSLRCDLKPLRSGYEPAAGQRPVTIGLTARRQTALIRQCYG